MCNGWVKSYECEQKILDSKENGVINNSSLTQLSVKQDVLPLQSMRAWHEQHVNRTGFTQYSQVRRVL
jgi:hypothetical protein